MSHGPPSTSVDEVVDGIYRIATFLPDAGITFNRFLIDDDRLRFLETPHVRHWDSMMLWEETTRSVFAADLYIQPGEQPPPVDEDLGAAMCDLYREVGIFAHERPVRDVVDRIEALDPRVDARHARRLAHRETIPRYTRAPRERPFAYDGRLFGREVVAPPDAVPGLGAPAGEVLEP